MNKQVSKFQRVNPLLLLGLLACLASCSSQQWPTYKPLKVQQTNAAAEAKLGEHGRVLLRASGTEPLVRVMVEAQSDNLASKIANDLAKVVQSELG